MFQQSQTEKLAKVYQPKRSVLSPKGNISVAHLLAARQDLSKILRTSSGSIREKTACAINKVTRALLISFHMHCPVSKMRSLHYCSYHIGADGQGA